jgi:16S rRNA (cytosine967-C5)-methyltransferase
MKNCRQFAYLALLEVYKKGAYTDIALNKILTENQINNIDKGLICELVYGIVRRQRTLDTLITQFSTKKAEDQPLFLKIILQIGLYQLRYLNQIPPSAAVNTSVELAKINKLGKLSGVVNGILREYIRKSQLNDPLKLPKNEVEKIGILESFPDWIVENFIIQTGLENTLELCHWYNQTPKIDLRVNILKTSLNDLEKHFLEQNIKVSRINNLPQGLRLDQGSGNIEKLPGFQQGWFTIQDSSAQLVSHFLDPQPGEVIIDTCAAPGGKTTHIAELIGDQGEIWACDIYPKRLKKVQENCDRLGLKSIKIQTGDSRQLSQFKGIGDRVLLDAPCSGLGTLHKRPDIRWRQTVEKIKEITKLQRELLENSATWVKKGGILVYATCTINQAENEDIINTFLTQNPQWEIKKPFFKIPCVNLVESEKWVKIWPHKYNMDGFFMVKLHKKG